MHLSLNAGSSNNTSLLIAARPRPRPPGLVLPVVRPVPSRPPHGTARFKIYPKHIQKRWSVFKQCFCKSGAATARGCGSTRLVHLHAGDQYTRLVLRSPGSSAHRTPRGDMFVYISAPALLGTIEAHPMSVALRGTPPHLRNLNSSMAACGNEGIFTLCESSHLTLL